MKLKKYFVKLGKKLQNDTLETLFLFLFQFGRNDGDCSCKPGYTGNR